MRQTGGEEVLNDKELVLMSTMRQTGLAVKQFDCAHFFFVSKKCKSNYCEYDRGGYALHGDTQQ